MPVLISRRLSCPCMHYYIIILMYLKEVKQRMCKVSAFSTVHPKLFYPYHLYFIFGSRWKLSNSSRLFNTYNEFKSHFKYFGSDTVFHCEQLILFYWLLLVIFNWLYMFFISCSRRLDWTTKYKYMNMNYGKSKRNILLMVPQEARNNPELWFRMPFQNSE